MYYSMYILTYLHCTIVNNMYFQTSQYDVIYYFMVFYNFITTEYKPYEKKYNLKNRVGDVNSIRLRSMCTIIILRIILY